MKKALAALSVLGLVVVAILLWWRYTNAEAAVEETTSTAKATRGAIRQEVQCTGRTVSNRDIEIKCRASGEIIKLPFDISDAVKEGDLLLELDPVDQERMAQQSQATLDASEARLAQAQNNLLTAEKTVEVSKLKVQAGLDAAKARSADSKAKAARQEELLQKKFSSPEQYETARTTAVQSEQDVLTAEASLADIQVQELDLETKRQDIKLAKAQAESNRIALGLAQRQLGYTKVFAPLAAVISARTVQIGQIISSGVTNIGGGTTAMVLSDLSHVFIYASVDESYIGDVKLGQRVRITADAYPRLEFEGKVDRIGTKGTNVQNVVIFEVRIEITSDNKTLLKPEMTANVYIIVAEKEDALLVPATSIMRRKQDTFVKLAKEDDSTEERLVQTGITDYVNTEVVDGLQEGDAVVVQKPEDESRWRNSPEGQRGMQNRMMMRTLGGGGGGGRH